MKFKVRELYARFYPADELWVEIKEDITLHDVWDCINNGCEIYDLLGVYDSIVRERVFDLLSMALGIEYDDICSIWLNND